MKEPLENVTTLMVGTDRKVHVAPQKDRVVIVLERRATPADHASEDGMRKMIGSYRHGDQIFTELNINSDTAQVLWLALGEALGKPPQSAITDGLTAN